MRANKVAAFAPAKINLSLDVLGRLTTGRHLIRTLIAPLSFGDDVEVEIGNEPGISIDAELSAELLEHLRQSGKGLERELLNDLASEKNLAWRAADRFLAFATQSKRDGADGCLRGVKVHILKRVPAQAGLGGGSSDAATTLLLLCELYPDLVPWDDLVKIAEGLGSDVPPFLYREPVLLTGSPERCFRLGASNGRGSGRRIPVVIVKPGEGISTREAYEGFGLTPSVDPADTAEIDRRFAAGGLNTLNILGFSPPTDTSDSLSKVTPHISEGKLTLLASEGSSMAQKESESKGIDVGFTPDEIRALGNDFIPIARKLSPAFVEIESALRSQGADGVLLTGSGSAVVGFFHSSDSSAQAARNIREHRSPGWFVQATEFRL